MEFHNNAEEDIEKLSRAIVDAIVGSKEVKSILSRLIEKNVIVDKGFMMLMIKVQALSELADLAEKDTKAKKPSKKKSTKQYIDGRELTPGEIAFLDYCSKNFNEKEWLKKAGITLEEEGT
ncbi:MAG: hypothetical protein HY096_02350 [Nitrospinae bacterium]|nr:hypothetical protein [Nitrospinota bacterium]